MFGWLYRWLRKRVELEWMMELRKRILSLELRESEIEALGIRVSRLEVRADDEDLMRSFD